MKQKGRCSKILSLIVISVMVFTLLIGCSEKTAEKTPEKTPAAASTRDSAIVTTPSGDKVNTGTGKIVGTPVTLSYWLELAPGKVTDVFKNMNETVLYKEMEKRTGVKINFLHPPTGQVQEQFNLIIASREFPDIIEYDWNKYPGGPEKAIKDGVIIQLNDLVDKYSPNFKRYMEERPDIKKQCTTDTGKYTNYPFLRNDVELLINFGPMFRKDWLNELGLPVPQTLDDWYTTLKAYKDKKGATAPFTFDMLRFPVSGLIVGAFGIGSDFYRDGNTIKFGPAEKPYKDFLALFSNWYREGLLDKDFASQDAKALDAKITSGKAGATAGLHAGNMATYLTLTKGNSFDLVGTPFPSLKAGDKVMYDNRNWHMSSALAAITTANKHPEVSAKYLDYGYGADGIILFNYGIEGVSFTMKDGKYPLVDSIKNPAKGTIYNAMSNYMRSAWNGPFIQTYEANLNYQIFPQQSEAITVWSRAGIFDTRVPPISPLPEESSKMASMLNDLRTYYREHYVKMIMCQEPVDNFDKFVNDMKKLGLDDILKIYNNALARYNKK